jgi:uncharacterized protein YkwD
MLMAGLAVLLLATGCGGRGNGAEESVSTKKPEHREQDSEERSGGYLVETCGGSSIRLDAPEKVLLKLHNEARRQRGLESLCLEPALVEAARAHSRDMMERDYFAHTSPDGETLGERLKRFGYTPEGYGYWKVGGNIAWHSGSEPQPENMFEGWMDSEGHRDNILSEDFRQIGIGTYTGQYKSYEESIMYTADFGVRRE